MNRRDFLQLAGCAGITAALIPSSSHLASSHPPAADKLVFLFQGDSITDGNRGRDYNDLNHIMGHGYACNIAGRAGVDFPEKDLRFINRGISGNRITDLAARWQVDALDLKPDVLSILVGINDTASVMAGQADAVSVALYEETYRRILDQAKAVNPAVLFVLCEPFMLPFERSAGTVTDKQLDVMQRQQVVRKLAAEYKAVFVPFQDLFERALKRAPEKYWIWDQIHPTVAGHELMSREWLKQVGKRIGFLRRYM
ncbi:MAG: GDSL-type esterase/lipase family protein [Candidatus Pseudobacter hemicellulosilyticus]|uniref:GDSL-type esterase/lipase family protein n=1 Tax=Candidatus Pseudobacter hemicellulosilyticus TaxID=3121375 RepID=A0AAJ6BFG6_9BACT|nr:MAG: GDSL-type esterase/lipase family protein [Pseudobacter sp.]